MIATELVAARRRCVLLSLSDAVRAAMELQSASLGLLSELSQAGGLALGAPVNRRIVQCHRVSKHPSRITPTNFGVNTEVLGMPKPTRGVTLVGGLT